MKELKKYLLAKIDINYYDAICELERERQARKIGKGEKLSKEEKEMTREQMVENVIDDFLEYISLNDKNLKQYKKDDNDFWNDESDDGRYWADMAGEWADSQVEVYTYTLWQEASILSDWIEEAIEEFGYDKERGMSGVLMSGQYHFYSGIANDILNNIKEYND
jgi:hypothetical protein